MPAAVLSQSNQNNACNSIGNASIKLAWRGYRAFELVAGIVCNSLQMLC